MYVLAGGLISTVLSLLDPGEQSAFLGLQLVDPWQGFRLESALPAGNLVLGVGEVPQEICLL